MNNQTYTFKPIRFFSIVFMLTWVFWITAAFVGRSGEGDGATMALMLMGLLVPSVTAICMVLFSNSVGLKRDFRNKLLGLSRVRPLDVLISVMAFCVIIAVSILLSTLFGQSLGQFAFVEGFSFSIGGVSALLILVLTAFLEELGWRGYAMDSIATNCNWWKTSLIFGVVWSLWHFPLFFIPETYQYNILQESPWFMVNFFVSIVPMVFLFTWVYVKNNRSILACMFFHFAVNFLQEQIAMTPITKCVETIVLFVAAGIVVALNKELFFEKRHIGNLLEES